MVLQVLEETRTSVNDGPTEDSTGRTEPPYRKIQTVTAKWNGITETLNMDIKPICNTEDNCHIRNAIVSSSEGNPVIHFILEVENSGESSRCLHKRKC
jgi:hypothetical protein